MRRRADVSNDLHYLPATGVVIVSCVALDQPEQEPSQEGELI